MFSNQFLLGKPQFTPPPYPCWGCFWRCSIATEGVYKTLRFVKAATPSAKSNLFTALISAVKIQKKA
jgi:hypothetical protein